MNKTKVEKLISIRIAQAVILSNHLEQHKDHVPDEAYVQEKTTTYPILDSSNQASMDQIIAILNNRYGLDLPRNSARYFYG